MKINIIINISKIFNFKLYIYSMVYLSDSYKTENLRSKVYPKGRDVHREFHSCVRNVSAALFIFMNGVASDNE